MQIGKTIARVLACTPRLVFAEARVGRWWYVLYWRPGRRPLCVYRSIDGTPPRDAAHGRAIIGTPPRPRPFS